jgi:S1-C subfamily serine protease
MNRFPPGAVAGAAALVVAAAALASGRVNATPEGRSSRHTPVVEAVERAAPAVVNITTDALTRRGVGRGSGSGVIVHPDGYVVTNSHVVRGTQRIYVSLCKKLGLPPVPAVLLQDDPSHDLALLRITRPGGAFPYVRLCPTSEVLIGETAIAIGNPYGLGDTVTVGIVSATGRRAAMPNGHTLRNLLQTDASINLGNSGGALLNLDGALIGINCSIHPSAQGISFTVPADDVRALLQRNLVQASTTGGGRAAPAPTPPRASATAGGLAKPAPRPVAPRGATLDAVGLRLEPSAGAVRIAGVAPDSSADIAGLAVGDLVLEVDDEEVESVAQIEKALGSGYAGRTYFIGIQRGHEPQGRKRAILVYPGS